jgi:hypothetical protein
MGSTSKVGEGDKTFVAPCGSIVVEIGGNSGLGHSLSAGERDDVGP